MKYGYSDDDESVFPPKPVIWFMVDGSNGLTTKEYEPPSPKKIWDRLVSKFNVATGRSPLPTSRMRPMRLPNVQPDDAPQS